MEDCKAWLHFFSTEVGFGARAAVVVAVVGVSVVVGVIVLYNHRTPW